MLREGSDQTTSLFMHVNKVHFTDSSGLQEAQ